MKGRYIGENIRLISDVMEYTKVQNIPGILLSLDFHKAFDSIEWPFIMKTLDYFNFGTGVKKWVSTLYTNIESAVLNNGFATNWFKPSKGVRQGCPLSPYLFILSAEILAHKIRQDPEFRGIKSQCQAKSDMIIKIADTAKKSISLILSILIDPYTK